MNYSQFRQYGSDCYMVTLDPKAFTIHATNTNQRLETVSSVAWTTKADIVINGDGWYSSLLPLSIAANGGVVYQPVQYDYRPFVNFSKNNAPMIDHRKADYWNTVSGTRYMVKGGVKQSGTSSAWTERNPRTAIGIRTDGFVILLVVDGRTTQSAGVTLHQLADILAAHNAKDAIELDGGGSSAMWIQDKIVNVPSDGRERPVVNHLVFKNKNKETPMIKITKVTGKITALGSNTRTREGQPSTYAPAVAPTLSAGQSVEIDEIHLRTETESGKPHNYKGDLWGKHKGKNLFTAIDYHDTNTFAPYPICTKNYTIDEEVPPPPPPEPVKDFLAGGAALAYDGESAIASITIPDGITLKIKVNGSDISWSK
jgi:hypothetical protein